MEAGLRNLAGVVRSLRSVQSDDVADVDYLKRDVSADYWFQYRGQSECNCDCSILGSSTSSCRTCSVIDHQIEIFSLVSLGSHPDHVTFLSDE